MLLVFVSEIPVCILWEKECNEVFGCVLVVLTHEVLKLGWFFKVHLPQLAVTKAKIHWRRSFLCQSRLREGWNRKWITLTPAPQLKNLLQFLLVHFQNSWCWGIEQGPSFPQSIYHRLCLYFWDNWQPLHMFSVNLWDFPSCINIDHRFYQNQANYEETLCFTLMLAIDKKFVDFEGKIQKAFYSVQ
jgi:hypothetical protein